MNCEIQPTAVLAATLKQLSAPCKTEVPGEIHLAKNFTSKNYRLAIPILPQTFGLLVLALKKWDLPTKAHILYDFLFLISDITYYCICIL